MKFCKDCKYCVRELWCIFPNKISAVTGQAQSKFCTVEGNTLQKELCIIERMLCWPFHYIAGTCGKSGRYFEKADTNVQN